MVFVDFSNPYLRRYLERAYLSEHEANLDKVRLTVPRCIADGKGDPRPLAAVMDIDEVVLANIHMNVDRESGFFACDYYRAPDGRPWPRDDTRLNPLLPGAKKLLEAFKSHDVTIFFITGRAESLRAETVENFEYVGLAGPPGRALFATEQLLDAACGQLAMCPDAQLPATGKSIRPFKEARRAEIASSYRIIMNVGDQASDLGNYGDMQILLMHPFYRTA